MAYRQVLQNDQVSATFDVDGESYFMLSHPGGAPRYTLAVEFPDGTGSIPLIQNMSEHTEQRLVVPAGTKFIITGNTGGAKAWIAPVHRDRASQLLGG